MKISVPLILAVLCAAGLAACDRHEATVEVATPGAAAVTISRHEHHPPHGGTPVVLGAEVYHLELVLDPATGTLSAYVLDGEMENFIRIAAPALEIVATVNGAKQTLFLAAVANSATGEKTGDTALFQTSADWLKTTKSFDAVLSEIEVRGTTFTGVAFNFPKGNDKD